MCTYKSSEGHTYSTWWGSVTLRMTCSRFLYTFHRLKRTVRKIGINSSVVDGFLVFMAEVRINCIFLHFCICLSIYVKFYFVFFFLFAFAFCFYLFFRYLSSDQNVKLELDSKKSSVLIINRSTEIGIPFLSG